MSYPRRHSSGRLDEPNYLCKNLGVEEGGGHLFKGGAYQWETMVLLQANINTNNKSKSLLSVMFLLNWACTFPDFPFRKRNGSEVETRTGSPSGSPVSSLCVHTTPTRHSRHICSLFASVA